MVDLPQIKNTAFLAATIFKGVVEHLKENSPHETLSFGKQWQRFFSACENTHQLVFRCVSSHMDKTVFTNAQRFMEAILLKMLHK